MLPREDQCRQPTIAFRIMIDQSPHSPTPQLFQQTVDDSKRAIAERGETSVMRHNK